MTSQIKKTQFNSNGMLTFSASIKPLANTTSLYE